MKRWNTSEEATVARLELESPDYILQNKLKP